MDAESNHGEGKVLKSLSGRRFSCEGLIFVTKFRLEERFPTFE